MSARRSITFQITLLFAAASTLVLLILGLIVGASVQRHFEELDLELLDGKLELVGHVLEKLQAPGDLETLPQRLGDSLVGHHGLSLAILAADGRTLFETGDAAFPPALLRARQGAGPSPPEVWRTPLGQPFRGIAAAVTTGIPDYPPVTVALATETTHHLHFMSSFQLKLWSVVVVAALATGFLGWVAVRQGLAPLRGIRQRAASVTADRLDLRLTLESLPPELAELADTFNAMLSRLEGSFRRLSDFSSDLAHELRTPVSNLLTQTQVTLSQARTADDYRDILASNAEELERLSRIIADMLFLAKADNDLIVPSREAVDLAAEVRGLFEFYEALAEEKGIRLALSGGATVAGDRLMLRRALSNLLSNAIRHTPAGGEVAVGIAAGAGGETRLSVANTGGTIPPEHLPRLFDRFYRVDASRHRFGEGAGLGLAITRSIVRAHGGEAQAASRDGITCFELVLPATADR